MAEILLSLTIIGIVAAITLPSLTGNINERTWTAQKKALFSRMSQAIALMPALNGYGSSTENAAETFLTAGLAKVLKINNICDSEGLDKCGLASKIILANGTKTDFPKKLSALNPLLTNILDDTNAAGFETANGESIAVFYNPKCASDLHETTSFWSQPKMCVNFVFDLNGKKGPNTIGKDMGVMTALYATDSVVVMPIPTTADPSRDDYFQMSLNINNKCADIDPDNRIPNREELASMFYNRNLVSFNYNSEGGGNAVGDYWATPLQPTSATAFCLRMTSGQWLLGCTGGFGSARCVKR